MSEDRIGFPPIERIRPASISKRMLAALVDQSVMSILTLPLLPVLLVINVYLVPAAFPSNTQVYEALVQIVFFLAETFFYYGWFYLHMGATPGKLLFGLRVIHYESGDRLGYSHSFTREVVGKTIMTLVVIIPVIALSVALQTLHLSIFIIGGLLPIAVSRLFKSRRMIHDFISGTQVVTIR